MKRDAASGKIRFEMIERYGETGDDIPKKCRGIRTIEKVNSVGIYLRTANGEVSELRFTKSSLIEYDGKTLVIYDPEERELNEQEKEILAQWNHMQEEYLKQNPYFGTYWKMVNYFNERNCPYLVGKKKIGGKRYINGKIQDDTIKGNAVLKYRIHNERRVEMINVSVQYKEKTSAIELPIDRFVLHSKLWELDIREKASNIKLTNADDAVYKVKISSDSDFGNAIIKLFNEDYSLDSINTCLYKLENARLSILEDMEGDILHEQFKSPEDLMEELENRISELIKVNVNYYCPLVVNMDDDECTNFIEVDNSYALVNEETIRERLMTEQEDDLNNMAFYFDGSQTAKDKLVSAVWDVEEVNGILYGVIHTGLTEAFTPEEEKEWIDELTGQASDGFGEGFEQREIRIDDGYIYVSFWNGGDDYFMENETEFRNRIAEEQNMDIQM